MVQKKLPFINSAHGSDTRNIINEIIKAINDRGLEILSESSFLIWLEKNGIKHREEVATFSDLPSNDALNTVRGVSDDNKIYIKKENGWVPFQTINVNKLSILEDEVEKRLTRNELFVSPEDFGVKYDGTDESVALQNAINYAFENGLPLQANGKEIVTNPVHIPSKAIKPDKDIDLKINGHLRLKAHSSNQPYIIDIRGRVSVDTLVVDGGRKACNGIISHNFARSTFDHVEVRSCLVWGWQWTPKNNNNHVTVNHEYYFLNGSRQDITGSIESKNNIKHTEKGYATVNLNEPLRSYAVDTENSIYFVRVNDVVYRVHNVVNNTTININHLDLPLNQQLDIRVYIGGGLDIAKHNDSNVGTHNSFDAQSIYGIGCHESGLYGHTFTNFAAQGCGVGYGCRDLSIRGVMVKPYFEVNNFDWVIFNYYDGVVISPLMNMDNIVYLVQRLLYGKTRISRTQFISEASNKVRADMTPQLNRESIELQMGRENSMAIINKTMNVKLMNTRENELYRAQSTRLHVHVPSGATGKVTFTMANTDEKAPSDIELFGDATLEIYKSINNVWRVNTLRVQRNVSINTIPSYIGQITTSGVNAYVSIATNNTDDWKLIT